MQIATIRRKLKAFKCKLEACGQDSKNSNANFNHLKGIWSIQMQIKTIRKGSKAFECKLELLVKDSRHSNSISSHSKGIQRNWMQIYPFDKYSKHSNANHSKVIRSIQMQILTIWKGFEFKRDSKHSNTNSNLLKRDLKHSNTNSNHLKGIRSNRMQILTLLTRLKGFEC